MFDLLQSKAAEVWEAHRAKVLAAAGVLLAALAAFGRDLLAAALPAVFGQ